MWQIIMEKIFNTTTLYFSVIRDGKKIENLIEKGGRGYPNV